MADLFVAKRAAMLLEDRGATRPARLIGIGIGIEKTCQQGMMTLETV
ncbi:MAG: hypothetical protein N838_07345 [Thiohalocapsa sp. PB-PSB1]|nr:MAG: hypothetical protein N838_07345 [Thiohalocapsa sp. PB-PSB1]